MVELVEFGACTHLGKSLSWTDSLLYLKFLDLTNIVIKLVELGTLVTKIQEQH